MGFNSGFKGLNEAPIQLAFFQREGKSTVHSTCVLESFISFRSERLSQNNFFRYDVQSAYYRVRQKNL